jgi:hypothetical protein
MHHAKSKWVFPDKKVGHPLDILWPGLKAQPEVGAISAGWETILPDSKLF